MIRRLAREVALQALFQIDFTGVDGKTAVAAAMAEHEDIKVHRVSEADAEEMTRLGETTKLSALRTRETAEQKKFNYVEEYALLLVNGVLGTKDAVDVELGQFATNWSVERMPATDRNILRIAAFEILHAEPKVAAGIAINEAVEIAKSYGTDESPRFVNGILGKLVRK